MNDNKTGTSWWQTIPGILTGMAAVITALGGMLAVLYQSGLLSNEVPSSASTNSGGLTQLPVNATVVNEPTKENSPPNKTGQVSAGHYNFKLLSTQLESYSIGQNGKPQKYSLRLSLRVTDVLGKSDYVDRRTIRLSVDGAELMPENSINFAVYDRQSAETEAVFIVPADASVIALLLGRPEDAVAKLPLTLDLSDNR